jgi:hypothetical protein
MRFVTRCREFDLHRHRLTQAIQHLSVALECHVGSIIESRLRPDSVDNLRGHFGFRAAPDAGFSVIMLGVQFQSARFSPRMPTLKLVGPVA